MTQLGLNLANNLTSLRLWDYSYSFSRFHAARWQLRAKIHASVDLEILRDVSMYFLSITDYNLEHIADSQRDFQQKFIAASFSQKVEDVVCNIKQTVSIISLVDCKTFRKHYKYLFCNHEKYNTVYLQNQDLRFALQLFHIV